ncbi:2,3-dihydroxy-2,3-dihydrophenylpropionate dehydrogenase [Corynebacterium oculi]|uniref:2,3-dihydroxy-2,3-dihydrophenylpropionate dehydrogenase n=2 Tax=Corynebacterium oculi TaxID=1544416 RepID=A0A0Q0Z4K7_9CORY|nr:2,3-dihydroxy-2,3-dihydrophenylpropionate dehydrogenase [Corynebacterium oculi]
MAQNILIVGVGGLGEHMVYEALERGARVSVMVRDEAKLRSRLSAETLNHLEKITVGDATDTAALDEAMQGIDVVISGNGAHRKMAREMAQAVRCNGVQKLLWPAGGTNLMAEDGVTPAYLSNMSGKEGSVRFNAEKIYRAHQVCIDEIRAAGVNYVIFCPGRMTSVGYRSPEVASTVRVNRVAGMSVSYEDAAWVMIEAALTSQWDGELISAATPA